MSFEAIQQVTAAEQAVQQRRAEAAEEAKRLAAEAERAGRQSVMDARDRAEARAKELLSQAEARAGETSRRTLAENAAQCEALKQTAMSRLDQAADLIIGKVGG